MFHLFQCGVTYDPRDIVILNPNEEDLPLQRERMLYRKSKKYPSINPGTWFYIIVAHFN